MERKTGRNTRPMDEWMECTREGERDERTEEEMKRWIIYIGSIFAGYKILFNMILNFK